MSTVIPGRMTAEIEGDFVVFLIGMRINRLWKVHKWLPMFMAMPKMLAELSKDPDAGFLGYMSPPIPTVMVQYWRSFEELERYARSKERNHWPAWVDFNRRVNAASGDVGIWHETFRVRAGEWESVYASMPPTGLGKAAQLLTVGEGRQRARERMQANAAASKLAPAEVGELAIR